MEHFVTRIVSSLCQPAKPGKGVRQCYEARMQIPYVVHSWLANFYFIIIIILSVAMDGGHEVHGTNNPEGEKRNMSDTANYGAGTSIRIVPEVAYLNRQANELTFAGKPESARVIYEQALGIDPSSATTWHNKGCCLDELGEYTRAIECFDQAIRIDPYNAESWFNKGMCQKRIGKIQESNRSVEHAIRLARGLED